MESSSVVIALTSRLTPDQVARIQAVDLRVTTRGIAELLSAERRWRRAPEQEDAFPAERRRELADVLSQAEVIFGMDVPRDVLSRAPKLRWVQLTSAGADLAVAAGVLQSGISVTDASGIHRVPMGEHVLGAMLALQRQLPRFLSQQAQRRWGRVIPGELRGQTLGILGLGAIGSEVARLAKAFGMRVLAIRRSAAGRQENQGDVDVLYPPGELEQVLAESDFVLVAAPLTRETRGMLGEKQLRRMKPTAHIINIARGPIIDEAALLRALKEGWIAGAALDVFEREPLPPESEFWGLPNVLITPHIAGGSPFHDVRATELFCENLKRYLTDQPLKNLVDKNLGY